MSSFAMGFLLAQPAGDLRARRRQAQLGARLLRSRPAMAGGNGTALSPFSGDFLGRLAGRVRAGEVLSETLAPYDASAAEAPPGAAPKTASEAFADSKRTQTQAAADQNKLLSDASPLMQAVAQTYFRWSTIVATLTNDLNAKYSMDLYKGLRGQVEAALQPVRAALAAVDQLRQGTTPGTADAIKADRAAAGKMAEAIGASSGLVAKLVGELNGLTPDARAAYSTALAKEGEPTAAAAAEFQADADAFSAQLEGLRDNLGTLMANPPTGTTASEKSTYNAVEQQRLSTGKDTVNNTRGSASSPPPPTPWTTRVKGFFRR